MTQESGQARTRYDELYRSRIEDPARFWSEAAEGISWIRRPQTVLDDANAPLYRWFPDGVLNTCYNALDRHVIAGRADQAALIYDSPVTQTKKTYTYAQLLDLVARAAGMLRDLGVGRGDRVLLYLPMIPEAVISMLACARLGAVHSVVFGGFAPGELSVRIDDARPDVVISASCGIEPTRVVEYKPRHVVVVQRPPSPSRPPTRCTCSTPRARPAGRRGWSGTTAGTRWRCTGPCATSTTCGPAR